MCCCGRWKSVSRETPWLAAVNQIPPRTILLPVNVISPPLERALLNCSPYIRETMACLSLASADAAPADSLQTGKITGNFTKIGPFCEKLSARTQQNQLVAGQFPTK